MCGVLEEMRKETAKEERMEIARRMLESGRLSCEEVANYVGLTKEEVESLDEKVMVG